MDSSAFTFKPAHTSQLLNRTKPRPGELKIGEKVWVPNHDDWEVAFDNYNGKVVLVGIKEDVGVRANLGVGGTQSAWEAALSAWLNASVNFQYIHPPMAWLGVFEDEDWLKGTLNTSTESLRKAVELIDDRVYSVFKKIFDKGKIPVVIGGGHNNAYPLLKAAAASSGGKVNATNLDFHADLRNLEGRHSGNGFSYAIEHGFLNRYAIVGLSEYGNNERIFDRLNSEKRFSYSTFESIFVDKKIDFDTALQKAIQHVESGRCGIELDMDAIAFALSSAQNPDGFQLREARQYLRRCCEKLDVAYVHIPEAAFLLADGRKDELCGKRLSILINDAFQVLNCK